MSHPIARRAAPPFLSLSLVFFRIVNFTFGGGEPTMAALQRELVSRRRWLSAEQYGLAYALARVTPGTNLIAFSTGVAWMLRGWMGALAAAGAGTLPSALIVVWLTYAYEILKTNAAAAAAIGGMLASAVGMMLAAAWNLLRPHLRKRAWRRAVVFAASSTALSLGLSLGPLPLLGLAALAGFFWKEPSTP